MKKTPHDLRRSVSVLASEKRINNDATVLKSSFQDWHQPIALIHDCLKVLPNDMDKAKERVKHGFVQACKGDPLARLADEMEVSSEQLPRLKQGSGDLSAVIDSSSYMFN